MKLIAYYKKFLNLLRGKKTSISLFIGALIAWLQYYGKINPVDAALIMTFFMLLGFSVNYTDYRMSKK